MCSNSGELFRNDLQRKLLSVYCMYFYKSFLSQGFQQRWTQRPPQAFRGATSTAAAARMAVEL